MMQLFEMVLIEIVEESARADGMPRDLEVVNVMIPVGANVGGPCGPSLAGRFTRSAEYVTPQRIGGRVTPTKSGSAVKPRFASLMATLDGEHAANPGDNLRSSEGDCDSENRREAPAPGDAVRHGHAAEHHHEDDRDGCEPCGDVGL